MTTTTTKAAVGHRRRPQGGFTLVELLVVVVILGILAAVVVFAVRGSGDKGRKAAVDTDERIIRTALEVFCAKNGRYPGGPAAPTPPQFVNKPMDELVAGKFLGNPSDYHELTTGDNDAQNLYPEGKCAGTPKNYNLVCRNTPVPCGTGGAPPPQQSFRSVSGGLTHSLRLTTDGKVFASGDNRSGQLGDGTRTNRVLPVPLKKVPGGPDFDVRVQAVAAGSGSSLALTSDGDVWAWGDNSAGQLGNDEFSSGSLTPVQVKAGASGTGFLKGITAISMSGASYARHALALRGSDGTVWAWGLKAYGQLGDGSSGNASAFNATPVQVKVAKDGDPNTLEPLAGVTAIDAAGTKSLALKDGSVLAWGRNEFSRLGVGSDDDFVTTPRRVKGGASGTEFLEGVTAIASGDEYSVALIGGTVWEWGAKVGRCSYFCLESQYVPEPQKVESFGDVKAIAAGGPGVLASKNNGTVWAWGSNCYGAAGNEGPTECTGAGMSTKNVWPAVQVKGYGGVGTLVGATALSGGGGFSLAVMDGRVLSWGYNMDGALGTGGTEDSSVPSGPYPPVNDAFAAGRVVTGPTGSATGTNRFATPKETGEPDHNLLAASGGVSVWYRWVAPATGAVTFNTTGSTFNTTMGVYTGASVSGLTTVMQNDDNLPSQQSRVVFQATSGVEYHIAVDGKTSGDLGAIKLAWTLT